MGIADAAVEAARAGEAGAGFAVVADEVRNLAMRAAEAAKNTSDLIDGTVQKVTTGSLLLTESSDSFYLASNATTKISTLVSEIAAASKEQEIGISQLNAAVTDIDNVTQENAAHAEESAAASADLKSEASKMNDSVNELMQLVGSNVKIATVSTNKHLKSNTRETTTRLSKPVPKTVKSLPSQPANPPASQNLPIDSIDDGDFEDF